MKLDTFNLLMEEYRFTKEKTCDEFNTRGQIIVDEYGLRTFHEVLEFVVENLSQADALLSHNASTAKLHIAIRKMLTLVNLRNPEFAIRGTKPTDEVAAELLDAAFPHELRRTRWARKMRWRNLWALLMGFGCTKLGVSSTFFYDEPAYTGKIPRDSDGELAKQFKGLPYGPLTEYVDPSVMEGEASIVTIPSTNVFSYPWDAPTTEHVMRWYIRWQRPLIDIYHDERYTNARGRVGPIRSDDIRNNAYFGKISSDVSWASKMGEVVEVYDVSSRKFAVIAESIDEPLRDWTPLSLRVDSPIHFFVPIESVKTWRGVPYALRIINQTKAINQLRSIVKGKIARDGKVVYFYDPLEMTPEQIAQVNHAKDGEFLPMKGMAETLSQGKEIVKIVEFGHVNPDVLNLMGIFEADLREGAGLDNPAMNTPNKSNVTATEAHLRSQQTSLDIQDYITTNEDSQEEVAGDYCRILLQKWPAEKLVKVTGVNEYSYFWVPVTRQMMLRDFTLEIVAGSTQKLDKATYTRQWTETVTRVLEMAKWKQLDAQAEAQGMPGTGMNWDELIKVTCDLFDPTISKRILKQSNPTQLLMRLMTEFGIMPRQVSPDIVAMIQRGLQTADPYSLSGPATGQSPMALPGPTSQPPGNVVPFQGGQQGGGGMGMGMNQMANPGNVNQQTGVPYGAMPGFGPGRQASEMMGRR